MLVKNISSRAHHVGDKVIAPNETVKIDPAYAEAINLLELVEVESNEENTELEVKPKVGLKKR